MKDNSKVATESRERTRYSELKRMLEERRREIQAEVQGRMRDVRSEGAWGGKQNEVFDAVESSEADIHGSEIAEKRLRALPFAVRCKDCEEAREVAEQRERQMAARRGTSSLFLDM
jgi:RNA polymerase-binding transcription factor DksA